MLTYYKYALYALNWKKNSDYSSDRPILLLKCLTRPIDTRPYFLLVRPGTFTPEHK